MMIDPAKLEKHVLELADTVPDGLVKDEVGTMLSVRKEYAGFTDEYIGEWVQSMLDKLTTQGRLSLKDGRYVLSEPVEIT